MRKLLEISSVAQCLDGVPSGGEPAFPRTFNLAMPQGSGKLFDHWSSAVRAAGTVSIRSRHRQDVGSARSNAAIRSTVRPIQAMNWIDDEEPASGGRSGGVNECC